MFIEHIQVSLRLAPPAQYREPRMCVESVFELYIINLRLVRTQLKQIIRCLSMVTPPLTLPLAHGHLRRRFARERSQGTVDRATAVCQYIRRICSLRMWWAKPSCTARSITSVTASEPLRLSPKAQDRCVLAPLLLSVGVLVLGKNI